MVDLSFLPVAIIVAIIVGLGWNLGKFLVILLALFVRNRNLKPQDPKYLDVRESLRKLHEAGVAIFGMIFIVFSFSGGLALIYMAITIVFGEATLSDYYGAIAVATLVLIIGIASLYPLFYFLGWLWFHADW
jgi:hypothetical protein